MPLTIGRKLSSDVTWWDLPGAEFSARYSLADTWEVDDHDTGAATGMHVISDPYTKWGALIHPEEGMYWATRNAEGPDAILAEWMARRELEAAIAERIAEGIHVEDCGNAYTLPRGGPASGDGRSSPPGAQGAEAMQDKQAAPLGRPRSGDDGKEPLRTIDLRLTVELKDQLQAAGGPMIATIRAALDRHLARQSHEPLTPIWGETLTSSKAELRASVVRAVHEEAERRGGSAAGVVREALAEWFAGREGGG